MQDRLLVRMSIIERLGIAEPTQAMINFFIDNRDPEVMRRLVLVKESGGDLRAALDSALLAQP